MRRVWPWSDALALRCTGPLSSRTTAGPASELLGELDDHALRERRDDAQSAEVAVGGRGGAGDAAVRVSIEMPELMPRTTANEPAMATGEVTVPPNLLLMRLG